MSAEEALTRRQVLVLLGAGGALALGGVTALVASRDGEDGTVPDVELEPALLALGQAVLATHPTLLAEPDALGGGVTPSQVADRPGDALGALLERIREDHAEGRILDVDGWVLSRTECVLAALYARG